MTGVPNHRQIASGNGLETLGATGHAASSRDGVRMTIQAHFDDTEVP